MKLPLYYEDIIEILPHRYPFLLVDRVTELKLGERVVGIKNISCNEPFFQGHFPGNPIVPGVLIIEGMAQVGGILARLTAQNDEGKTFSDIPFFMAMDQVKFRKPVIPGDRIVFEITTLRKGSRIWKVAGKAFVGDDLVAEAELLARLG